MENKAKPEWEKLEQELELLEFIESSMITKEDLFIMHWKNEKVMLISTRLRNFIKKVYPEIEWIAEEEISMEDWQKVWANLPNELTNNVG
ncbi:hypothetical protein [Xanthomarina gelatinilytica]|uniref:hypothetical protein n=1 Tax=Xanthomarina gelatinilytica TaxID=1137281 RepID=UPI003AA7F2E4